MPALYEQFFLFGDSITQDSFHPERGFGFSAALQAAYIRKLDVVNRGQSGYNTRQALEILPAIVPSPEQAKIRFLVVFFGANDASLPDAPNKQHVSLDEYKANLEMIITHSQFVAHRPRVILVTQPPLNEYLWWPRDQSNEYPSLTRVASIVKDYAEAACGVGAKLGIPVINLWKAIMEKASFKADAWTLGEPLPGSLGAPQSDVLVKHMYDGLHLTPAGYDLLFHELMSVIERVWPDQMPDNLPMVLPRWNDSEAWTAWRTNSLS